MRCIKRGTETETETPTDGPSLLTTGLTAIQKTNPFAPSRFDPLEIHNDNPNSSSFHTSVSQDRCQAWDKPDISTRTKNELIEELAKKRAVAEDQQHFKPMSFTRYAWLASLDESTVHERKQDFKKAASGFWKGIENRFDSLYKTQRSQAGEKTTTKWRHFVGKELERMYEMHEVFMSGIELFLDCIKVDSDVVGDVSLWPLETLGDDPHIGSFAKLLDATEILDSRLPPFAWLDRCKKRADKFNKSLNSESKARIYGLLSIFQDGFHQDFIDTVSLLQAKFVRKLYSGTLDEKPASQPKKKEEEELKKKEEEELAELSQKFRSPSTLR